jgi:transposase
LPAITVDSYLTHHIFQGAITSKIIEEFLKQKVLPLLQPSYYVLLIDNALIHQSPAIVELCKAFSVQLEFLPLYSPNYNPIKKSFKVLKS